MTKSLPLDGKSVKEKLEEIISDSMEFDAVEDSYDGHEPGSPEAIDNQFKWSKRIQEQYVQAILSLLLESMPVWLPPRIRVGKGGYETVAAEEHDKLISQTEENFREFIDE